MNRRLLVADDQPVDCDALRHLPKGEGLLPIPASFPETLAAVQKEEFGLAFITNR